jgi:hypothetical protein
LVANATNPVQAVLRELKGLKVVLAEIRNLADLLGADEPASFGASAAVEWEEDDLPPTELDRQNGLESENLADVCAELVHVEETGNTFRFVH